MGKLLFIPMLTFGHINVCTAIAKKMIQKYGDQHEIYFAVDLTYKKKLEKLCPKAKFILYKNPPLKKNLKDDEEYSTDDYITEFIGEFGKYWEIESREKFAKNCFRDIGTFIDLLIKLYPTITNIIKEIKPNFIFYDQLFTTPVGIDQGIPYGLLLSSGPAYFGHYQYPPPLSDLPSAYTPENVKLWEKFIDEVFRTGKNKELHEKLENWLIAHNCGNLDGNYFYYKESPYLNIYNYPRDLDYVTDEVKLPGKWIRMDSPVLKPYPEPYPIPEKLKNLSGKLIYFSLGSMASAYKPLMERLLDYLKQIPHRFIISLGPIGDQYKLYDNMYGEKFVNQLAILQMVNVIITHGGNNTLTECFHFGVPPIVLPLFGDQISNSVRVKETNLGCKLDPFKCSLKELHDAIEFCLSEKVQKKMKEIFARSHLDNGLDNVCEEIDKFL